MTTLKVFFRETLCGRLTEDRLGQLEFSYDRAWLESHGCPVSLTMPLHESAYRHDRVAPFIANLLPEGGDLRNRLERQLHVDARHNFGLLAAIGRESAGALSFWPEDQSPDVLRPAYAELDLDEFHRWRESAHRQPFRFLGDTVRLSLAGIQSKTALYFDSQGAPFVPLNGAATTHIIKPRLPGCKPNTVYTELATMRLARAVLGDSEVPEVDVWENCYRIRRYDRTRVDAGVQRQHQEDFCLALGRLPAGKYESGSPRERLLKPCFELIDLLGAQGIIPAPVLARQRLLNQVIINVLLHNPDAHLKNYSLLYNDDGKLNVAPLYDCLCTRGLNFDEGGIAWSQGAAPEVHTRKLSLCIGNGLNIDEVSESDWGMFALECGFTEAFVRRRVRGLAQDMIDALPRVRAEVIEAYPQSATACDLVVRSVEGQVAQFSHPSRP